MSVHLRFPAFLVLRPGRAVEMDFLLSKHELVKTIVHTIDTQLDLNQHRLVWDSAFIQKLKDYVCEGPCHVGRDSEQVAVANVTS